ncbi:MULTISPECIES: hypothetical protein [Burkholderia]|uniref:hypothetical protein n=1 Tax=Burkholderia TaxID=32008 RepID=UPI0012E38E25|nr:MULTISPECIES: hypothetical protein [Burkholderia]
MLDARALMNARLGSIARKIRNGNFGSLRFATRCRDAGFNCRKRGRLRATLDSFSKRLPAARGPAMPAPGRIPQAVRRFARGTPRLMTRRAASAAMRFTSVGDFGGDSKRRPSFVAASRRERHARPSCNRENRDKNIAHTVRPDEL